LEELIETFRASKSSSDIFYKLGHSEAFLKFKLIRDFGVDAKSLVNLSIRELVLFAKEKMWERKLEKIRVWLEKYGVKKSAEELKNLTTLALDNNEISDVSPLKGLENLTHLNLMNNKISDVSPLKELANLTHLNLMNNKISDVTALKGLANLTELSLGGNEISDVTALKGLANLIHLYLSYNNISDVSPLKGLENLTILALSRNEISGRDIEELKKMVKNFYF
jgi:Leucine-rich repeat (LRR) protein